jgi:hypothetical protein
LRGCQLGVCDRVLDVAMPQEELDGPRILLVVRQLLAAPRPELMGVHGESQPRELASPGDHRAHARIRQWPLTLGEKHIGCVSCQGFEFSKARIAVPVSGCVLGTPLVTRLTCKSP